MEGPYETADDAWVYQDFFTILEITDVYINKELKDQIPNKGPRTKEEGPDPKPRTPQRQRSPSMTLPSEWNCD